MSTRTPQSLSSTRLNASHVQTTGPAPKSTEALAKAVGLKDVDGFNLPIVVKGELTGAGKLTGSLRVVDARQMGLFVRELSAEPLNPGAIEVELVRTAISPGTEGTLFNANNPAQDSVFDPEKKLKAADRTPARVC